MNWYIDKMDFLEKKLLLKIKDFLLVFIVYIFKFFEYVDWIYYIDFVILLLIFKVGKSSNFLVKWYCLL